MWKTSFPSERTYVKSQDHSHSATKKILKVDRKAAWEVLTRVLPKTIGGRVWIEGRGEEASRTPPSRRGPVRRIFSRRRGREGLSSRRFYSKKKNLLRKARIKSWKI